LILADSRSSSRQRVRALTIVLVALGAGCASTSPAPPAGAPAPPAPVLAPVAQGPASPTVATIGDESITAAELRAEMESRGGSIPGQYQTLEQKRALLDDVVHRRVLADRAYREGLEDDPVFRATIERMLVQRLESVHLEPALAALTVSEEEISAYYETRRTNEYVTPARVRVAWIFVEVSPRATEEKVEELRQRAEAARREALALPPDTRGFGALSQKYSDDPASRYIGGELGWAYESQKETYRYGPEVLEAALALTEPGEVSPVLRLPKGFAIVRLVLREEAAPTPLDKLRAGIRNVLMREKREAVRRAFYEESLGDREVRVDDAALAAVEPPGEPKEEGAPKPPPLPSN